MIGSTERESEARLMTGLQGAGVVDRRGGVSLFLFLRASQFAHPVFHWVEFRLCVRPRVPGARDH